MVASDRSVFGFSVRAPRPLQLLRKGGGRGILRIRRAQHELRTPAGRPLIAWAGADNRHRPAAALYQVGSAFRLCTPTEVCDIHPRAATIELSRLGPGPLWEERVTGIPALLCFLHRGDVPLHGAAVELNGRAIVLAAPGRQGKTTLALAFHTLGYRVLSEDLSCCRLADTPLLLPGPALLRVRPDMLDGEPTGTRVVTTTGDRIHLVLDDERRGTGHPVPLEGIVLLRASPGEIALERVRPRAALSALWKLSFNLPTSSARARAFRYLAGLAGRVPVWELRRPLLPTALLESVDRIVTGCRQGESEMP